MMVLIGKLPRFGKYVQMFRTVASSVITLLVAYLPLLVAFMASFMIIFRSEDTFKSRYFPSSFLKLFVMMLGEIDLDPANQDSNAFQFSVSSHIFFFGFIFLVSIILMNLLVGLAVSDIQGLSKSAKINQLVKQVELIHSMEGLLFSPIFRLSPDRFKKFLRSKLQGLEGQNYNMVYTVKPFDRNDRIFSESLKMSLYDNCVMRESKVKEFNRDTALLEMQNNIRQISEILGGKVKMQHSASRLSVFSNMSAPMLVEEDYDSEGETVLGTGSQAPPNSFHQLNSITEERHSSAGLRLSSLTNQTISNESSDRESECGTVSDYVTCGTEDRRDSAA